MIVPVVEEEIVVTKRLVLKEEIHLVKRRTKDRFVKEVELNRERAEVRRLDADGRVIDAPRRRPQHPGRQSLSDAGGGCGRTFRPGRWRGRTLRLDADVEADSAAVRAHDPLHGRESEAAAQELRGEERIEDAARQLPGNAGADVTHFQARRKCRG